MKHTDLIQKFHNACLRTYARGEWAQSTPEEYAKDNVVLFIEKLALQIEKEKSQEHIEGWARTVIDCMGEMRLAVNPNDSIKTSNFYQISKRIDFLVASDSLLDKILQSDECKNSLQKIQSIEEKKSLNETIAPPPSNSYKIPPVSKI